VTSTSLFWLAAGVLFAIAGFVWAGFYLKNYKRARRKTQIALVFMLARAPLIAYVQALPMLDQYKAPYQIETMVRTLGALTNLIGFAALVFFLLAVFADRPQRRSEVEEETW